MQYSCQQNFCCVFRITPLKEKPVPKGNISKWFWLWVWYVSLFLFSSLQIFLLVLLQCFQRSQKVLGFVNFYEKSLKSRGILHSICVMNFLFQVVYNEFLPSCYARYSTSFSLFIYLFLELKYSKYWNLLSRNYFLFAFDRKCLKIIAFSKQDNVTHERQKACVKVPSDQCIKSLMPPTPAPLLFI